ncbi:MAG TPA: aminotransferase class V-fold PLP-dependent enzyme [Candidatus Limnocylindrales bacterium]|jgi:selenocysteine lyase/cysteine desulfurase|nr:aminotransferase class V-fold PLP-dependent enzyme [Candidatus Limnocylindrales bacterium]
MTAELPVRTQLRLVGDQLEVPLVTGGRARYVNLDFAASAPPLVEVAHAVDEMGRWYSSVHRGAGWKSQVATAAYEGARDAVARFLGSRHDDAILFTRNTTDSTNLLSSSLPEGSNVVAFAVEHHANMLPWRRHRVHYLPIPSSPDGVLPALEEVLRTIDPPTLVAMTGASNVTGELWPIRGATEIAHRYGARLFVDAAQLAPHVPIDIAAWDVDYLALSGHKLYAPYGAGVLTGRADWLADHDPFLRGGGAVDFVTLHDVYWTGLPDRQEAGSPNTIGAVALGVACETLDAVGMGRIEREEHELYGYARERLSAVEGLTLYSIWSADHPRLGILTFNLAGMHHSLVASALSAEWAVAVRHGCFCAHPLVMQLLHADEDAIVRQLAAGDKTRVPGAVRVSLGAGTTTDDVDRAAEALTALAAGGPSWTYSQSRRSGEYEPDPDPRPLPNLPFRLSDAAIHHFGESS